nr:hypothetical protein VCHA53O474_200033 [Vibrio chagasii]
MRRERLACRLFRPIGALGKGVLFIGQRESRKKTERERSPGVNPHKEHLIKSWGERGLLGIERAQQRVNVLLRIPSREVIQSLVK